MCASGLCKVLQSFDRVDISVHPQIRLKALAVVAPQALRSLETQGKFAVVLLSGSACPIGALLLVCNTLALAALFVV